MKIFKYIVWSLLLFFTVFYFLPAGLLKLPAVQKKISKEVASYLENKLGTEASIERVDFALFNQLIIKNVYLEDQSESVLLQAKRLSAGFEILPLLKKRVRIHSLQFYTFECNLSKETDDAPLNIQYVIDAFSSNNEKKEKTAVDLKINTINFRRGNFSFQVKDAPVTPGKFNSKDIQMKDFSAKIHLNKLTLQELDVKVNRLSFTEQSGFSLKRLSFDLISDENSTRINQLFLKLNKTNLQLKDIFAEYPILSGRDKDLKDVSFQMEIEPSKIYPREISAILPVFAQFVGKVDLSGIINGTPDDLRLTDFFVREPDFSIHTNVEIKNLITTPHDLYLKGSVRDTYIAPDGLDRLLNNFREEQIILPPAIRNMETLFIQANFEGSSSNFLFRGNLDSAIGSLDANLNMGGLEKPFIKGYASSSSLDLGIFLNNTDFGAVSFEVQLDAKQGINNRIEGDIDATIGHFFYKQHRYDNLLVDGEFSSEHFKGILDFDSPEGKIKAEGLFAFRDDNSNFQFHAEIDNIQLDKLNLT
ncbi:hypothetical protein LJC52_04240, partial [Bacteroidales bacterium OttesenSCG-928-A17]|nr:hypothetical protein [Bacteroidales bacterium OttesenSCG-928-A17]